MQVRHLDRVRDDGDRAAILFQLCNSQADAFNRNRTFVDGVFLDLCGKFDMQPPVLGVGDALELDEFADTIDVALNDVAPETAVGLHGQFEIHQRALVNARERSAHPGLGGKIGAEGSWPDVERGQADAANRDAVAGLNSLGACSAATVMRRFSPRCSMRVMRPTSSTMPVNMSDLSID